MPSFVPSIRLFTESLVIPADDDGLGSEFHSVEVPAISLEFDYGGTRLRASDPRRQFFLGQGGALIPVDRDQGAERAAARLLEGLGAIDLGCCTEWQTDPSSQADYVLPADGNEHTYCSFTAALDELRTLGWQVEIAPDYPYRVVEPDHARFYAEVLEDGKEEDWFGLELGIDVDGRRVDLLPALLSLLDNVGEEDTIASIMRVAAKFRAVATGEGDYVLIAPERLRTVLQILVELYQGKAGNASGRPGRVGFPGSRAASLAKLEAALSNDQRELAWKGHRGIVERGKTLLAGPTTFAPPSTEGLGASLRSYQERGLAWLGYLREQEVCGVLADDMGLGKTLQTIAHLLVEKRSGRMEKPSLIVMPTSLVGNWRRELARFAPAVKVGLLHGPKRKADRDEAMRCDVVLTTYPLLVRDLDYFQEHTYYYLILDEAQAIKNRASQVHKAVTSLSSTHRLCLTGTPIENNLEELRSIFAFLMPDLLGPAESFNLQFGRPIEQGADAEQLRALRDLVAPFLLRRVKEQVAPDLPPKTELVRYVELRGDQRELYESIRLAAHAEVRRAIRNKGIQGSSITILDALMKLRQVCCDPRIVSVNSAGQVRSSAKYDLLMDLLSAQVPEGRSVLVFSQFTTMLGLIADGLDERGISYVSLTGSTRDRQKPIDAFVKGEANVFLISLKAGGTGLNLTRADTVIHYDPWWNPAAQDQATDRAHRIGQTRPVFVYNLVVAGSVEERMVRLQGRKRLLAGSILGGTSPTPAPSAAGLPISEAEVDGLLAPLTA